MSGSQSSLLLRKGVVGQAYWPPTRIWHDIKVDKHPTSLDEIRVHWHKQKDGARSIIEQDMLRCVNLQGNEEPIYSGMMTMCRDDQVESELDELPGYRFGTVTAVTGDPARIAATHLQIEFRFEANSDDSAGDSDDDSDATGDNKRSRNCDDLPSRTITAMGSDLLYWAVPKGLTAADAKFKMGASDVRVDESDEAEEEKKGESSGDEEDSDVHRPARKRQAIVKFDPATFTVSPKARRVIQDDSSSSDSSSSGEDSGFDKELFPDSDEEGEGEGASAATANSWGTPTSSQGTSWGVAISSESNNSPDSGWGSSAIAVTPDSGHGWGRSSSSASSSGSRGIWGRAQTSGPNEPDSSNPSSWSSVLQYREMPTSRSSRIESKYLTKSEGELEIIREADDEFFLRWHFGSSHVKVVEVGLNLFDAIETTKEIGTEVYTLVASKYEQGADDHTFRSRLSKFGGRPYVKSYYVAGDFRSVQKKLDGIANFSDLVLAPGKLASRLELLVSTAAAQSLGGEKTPYTFKLPASHLEEIDNPENQTMGCGFIPGHMLEDFLGNNSDAKDAIAIQVRIVCPTLGIFKGVLVRKVGISKIQLPSSMKKVCKSSSRKKAFKGAFLLINSGGICPSQPTRQMERAINPQSTRSPTKTAEKDLRGIDNMMRRLLLGCGASADTLDEYNEACQSFQGRKHAYLTGVCDVTNGGLPPGTVFLSGWGVGEVERTVFITRSPCTERLDAAVLKVVSQQPDEMSDEHWQNLCSLPFGSVMFASPSGADAMPSLPESINSSDLDGDRFFCLWEPTLLSEVEHEIGVGVQMDAGNGDGGSNALDALEGVPEESETTIDAEDGEEGNESDSILKDVMDVVGHRGKGRNAQVEVEHDGGKRKWVDRNLVRDQMEDLLADYALRNNLLDEKGWKWARQYIHDAEIVEIKSHRFQGARKKCQVEVLYDGDPNTTWVDARSVDVDILAKYVESEGISLQCQEWQFLAKSIQKEKKQWLKTVQARIRDIKHLSDHNRFVAKLHGLHGKYAKEKGISDADSISLGRAYKSALDVCKHGGRVSLPRHLREEVAGKKGLSFAQFLKDS